MYFELRRYKYILGFTLIEIVSTLLIMGILFSLVIPNYRQHILRTHRIDGQSALIDLANRMEEYFARQHTYRNATIGTGRTSDVLSSTATSGGWYHLTISHATKNSYTLRATAFGSQRLDMACQKFTLNNFGIREKAKCW